MFITYLDLDQGRSQFDLAWMRFTDIVIGIAAAVLVGTFVWPNHARVRFLHSVSGSLEKIIEYCESFSPLTLSDCGADFRCAYEQVRLVAWRLGVHSRSFKLTSRDNLRSSLVYQVDNKQYTRLESHLRVSAACK